MSYQPADDSPLVVSDTETREAKPVDKRKDEAYRSRMLIISFCLMLVFGLGNRVTSILQFSNGGMAGGVNVYETVTVGNHTELVPELDSCGNDVTKTSMKSGSLFLNILSTAVYLPTSLAYIIPMIKYRPDVITAESRAIPQRVWLIMGTLDSIAGVMSNLATANLSNQGTLVVLLLQAAIPLSMLITKIFLKVKYRISQYVGAAVVIAGIVVVLAPAFNGGCSASAGGGSIALWVVLLILSCVPMCLSSVYKEKALGDTEIDPVYLNYWVAVYQLLLSFPLLIPSAYVAGLNIKDMWKDLGWAANCYVGKTIFPGADHATASCANAPLLVNIYLLFNLGYNVLIILLLKFGSANILWLCMTIQVPVAALVFAIPIKIFEGAASVPLDWEDGVGLVVIMTGLIIYRFFPLLKSIWDKKRGKSAALEAANAPLLASEQTDGSKQGTLEIANGQSPQLTGSTPLLGSHAHRSKNKAARQQQQPQYQAIPNRGRADSR